MEGKTIRAFVQSVGSVERKDSGEAVSEAPLRNSPVSDSIWVVQPLGVMH